MKYLAKSTSMGEISVQELTFRLDGSNGPWMQLRAGASGLESLFSVFCGYLCLKFKVVGKKCLFSVKNT